MPSARPTPRSTRKSKAGAAGQSRRRVCCFCQDKVDVIDHKNTAALRRVISEKGKIRASRVTGTCRRHQTQVAMAVKRARETALLPYASR
jgi:small subunit ribosomal protein S18